MAARIGEVLKGARERNKLTQGLVAETLGVHRSSIAQWESGVMVPSLSRLPSITSAYQLNADERAELASLLLGEAPAGAA